MNIAIVGATGIVGKHILKILHEKDLIRGNNITLFASAKHNGTKVIAFGEKYIIRELSENNLDSCYDFAFFSAGSAVSKTWAQEFVSRGAFVIDNSNAFRRDNAVPLVVPEINADTISPGTKLISNPNCSTIALALPMYAVSTLSPAKRIVVSTYQAVSGAGTKALEDLEQNTTTKLNHKIQNNLIPHIDVFLDDGYTLEEDKMRFELNKILRSDNIMVSATCVRVPIKNCHSESVNFSLKDNVPIKDLERALKSQKGVTFISRQDLYPMPILSDGKDDVFVGRLRSDTTAKNSYNMFISMDNIRKGAALNAVQIMEYIVASTKKDR